MGFEDIWQMYNYLQIYYVQGLMQEEYLKFLFLRIKKGAVSSSNKCIFSVV